jgi:hypothetical protein
MVDPLNVENRAPPVMTIRLSLPGSLPINLSNTSRVRFAMPECSINSPIKIKRGIGANENLTRDVNICCTERLRPLSPPIKIYAPIKLIRRNAKAMGSPMTRKNINPPIKNNNIAHHSISVPVG